MGVKLIWAQDKNGVIGVNNLLPWHLKEDLKHFQKTTQDSVVMMGRKTWESLPVKPLPNRLNIVLTRQKHFMVPVPENVEVLPTLTETINRHPNLWVIGGGEIYKETILLAEKLMVTVVNTELSGNGLTYAPSLELVRKHFVLTHETSPIYDESNGLRFCFQTFERKNLH